MTDTVRSPLVTIGDETKAAVQAAMRHAELID